MRSNKSAKINPARNEQIYSFATQKSGLKSKINPVFAIIFTVITLIIVVIIAWVVSLLNAPNIDLLVVPSSATITIDGEPYTSGSYKFSEGTHSIKVEGAGFITKEGSFKVGGEKIKVYIGLSPTEDNKTYYLDHPDEQMRLNTIGDYNAEINSAAYVARDIIFEHTPYNDSKNRFRVFSEQSDDNNDNTTNNKKITISIKLNTCSPTSAEIYKAAAMEWLENIVGNNTEKYNINFSTLCD